MPWASLPPQPRHGPNETVSPTCYKIHPASTRICCVFSSLHTCKNIAVKHAGFFRRSASHGPTTTQTLIAVLQEYADKALLKDPEGIAAFVELHIEQGPHLEAEKKDIGIVEAIMAPALLRVEFTGRGGHGGEFLAPCASCCPH